MRVLSRLRLVLLCLAAVAAAASAFDTTGILVFWRAGGACVLPPGAGARRFNSTPPEPMLAFSLPPRLAPPVWLGAARRYGRVKIVSARDGSARFVALRDAR